MSITLTANDTVQPAFAENNNLIILATDDNYILYCGVALTSLAENTVATQNYDIVILEYALSDVSKTFLMNVVQNKSNISLRFYMVKELIEPYKNIVFIKSGFTIAAYYRLFIVQIFSLYDRALYIDCDTVIDNDISEIFMLDFKGNLIAAVKDFILLEDPRFLVHLKNIFKLPDYTRYFNSGVILFNITALKESNFLEECFTVLRETHAPKHQDQDILNIVFQGKALYLDKKWNHFAAPKPSYASLAHVATKPCIIHFIGSKKPWTALQTPFSEIFWKYAEKTSFHAELVAILLKHLPKRLVLARKKYFLYKLLAYLPIGKQQQKYILRRDSYAYEIQATTIFLQKHGKVLH